MRAAVKGDEQAMALIIASKEAQINNRCSFWTTNEKGQAVRRLDEDMKSFIIKNMIDAIRKFHELL